MSDAVLMTYSQGSFPILSGEFTLTDGISPSVGTMTIAPLGTIDYQVGDLVFGIDSFSHTIKNVFITDIRQAAGLGSNVVTLTFKDARFGWQFGKISGAYNLRKPDGTIDSRTSQTEKQLLALLIAKLAFIASSDISLVTNSPSPPECNWDNANPAEELGKLCDKINCRVCYQRDNTLQIVPYGSGAVIDDQWPSQSLMQAVTINPRPDSISCLGAKKQYQLRIPLESVGRETDGSYQLLNDLSYKPANWGFPESLLNVADSATYLPDGSKTSPRELALQSVYRCYRIKNDLAAVFEFSGFSTPSGNVSVKREHVLPLPGSQLVETYTDTDGSKRAKDAFVSGVFFHSKRPDAKNTDPGTKCELSFSVDPRTGVVSFSQPIYKLNAGNADPAELFLHIAVEVKDPGTLVPLRYSKTQTIGSTTLGSGEQIIRQEDIKHTTVVNYDSSGAISGDPTVNTTDCDNAAAYYLAAAQKAWDRPPAAAAQHVGVPGTGLPNYLIDGAIQQITYRVGPEGCTVSVSRGFQHDYYVPPYEKRRKDEQQSKNETQVKDAAAAEQIVKNR